MPQNKIWQEERCASKKKKKTNTIWEQMDGGLNKQKSTDTPVYNNTDRQTNR